MTDPYDESQTAEQPDSGWIYIAPATVYHQTGRVLIPDGLLDVEILKIGEDAYWAYERVTGVLIVSNTELEDPEYHTVEPSTVYTDKQCKIPEVFFPPGHDARPEDIARKVHEKAYVRRDERRHFVYQTDPDKEHAMEKGETRSCYVLTDDELQDRLSGPDDWVGNFESIPQFF